MDKSNGTGCPDCGMVYSLEFGMQFHKKGCPALTQAEREPR